MHTTAPLPSDPSCYWGHRGIPHRFPENTLEGFQAAIDAGVTWIEADVDICQDGTLLICHDSTLDRTTNGTGPVAHHTYEELKNLDAGSWFSPEFKGVHLPTLGELVDLVNRTGVNLNLELKPCEEGAEYARELIRGAARELSRIDLNGAPIESRIAVSSFSHLQLRELADVAPEFPRAALFSSSMVTPHWRTEVELMGATAIHPQSAKLTKKQIHRYKDAGLQVRVWTVNREERVRQLFKWGVDAVFTDMADHYIQIAQA